MPERKVNARTWYTIEINYNWDGPGKWLPETPIEHKFNKAVGFTRQSNGYGTGYRNVTYFLKDYGKTCEAFKRAVQVARRLIRTGMSIQVQIHALMR